MLVMVLSGMFTACNDSGSKVINIAFQSEEDGRWGMMTTSGKVIFEDEFERMPSASVNGYFTVKNGEGMWEIYSAEEKPKQIGDEYLYVGPFVNGVAPVVEKGKPITLINTEGKVVVTLDKLSGKTVKYMEIFSYGRSIFTVEDEEYGELRGMINTKGKVLIEPEYPELTIANDMVLGVSKKEHDKMEKDDTDIPGEVIIFSLNGKEQSRINLKKNDITALSECAEGLLKVEVRSGSSRKIGLMNEKGEWVVKPSTKVKDIGDVSGKKFVYYNGERCGLMNYDGDILIRAKYNYLTFVTEKVLAATEYNNGDREDKLIDLEGNDISNDTWEVLIGLGDGHTLAKESSHSWVIIDAKGKTVSDKKLDIYDFNFGYRENILYSDYFDIAAMLDKLSITKDGVGGFTLSSGVESIVKALEKETSNTYDPDDYRYDTYFSSQKDLGETTANIIIFFDGDLTEGITETRQETDWFGRVQTYETITGYKWSKAKVKSFFVQIPTGGKMRGKESDVYKTIVSQVTNAGKVSKQDKTFTVISAGNDKSILVTDEGSSGVELLYLPLPTNALNNLTDDIVADRSDLYDFLTRGLREYFEGDEVVEVVDAPIEEADSVAPF